jgi:hypothetical protein
MGVPFALGVQARRVPGSREHGRSCQLVLLPWVTHSLAGAAAGIAEMRTNGIVLRSTLLVGIPSSRRRVVKA